MPLSEILLMSLALIFFLFFLLSLVSIAYPIKKLGFKTRDNALAKSLTALTLSITVFFLNEKTSPRIREKIERERQILIEKNKLEHRRFAQICRDDIECYVGYAVSSAGYKCAELVEQLAPHAFEWIFRSREDMFSSYAWLDQETGSITMVGDAIEFQEASGEWQQMRYECDVNPATERVFDSRVRAVSARAN